MNTLHQASRYLQTLGLVLGLLGWGACVAAQAASDKLGDDGIYERTLFVPGADTQQITFFLKLPPGAKSGTDIKGVFSFCTWESDPKLIRARMNGKLADGVSARVSGFAPYAHGLAMVSWTTFAGGKAFDKKRNFDELTKAEALKMEVEFNKIARIWRRGIDELVKDYKLPEHGWFLYGMSRGGQWAHRLALRQADLFAAVHIHINSTYDQPTPEAATLLWLVSTGELEAGYPAAKRFYAAARKQNYNMIFYAEPNLGHEDSPRVRLLSSAFFNYALKQRTKVPATVKPDGFIGDYLKHEFVTLPKGFKVSSETQVYLPSREIAEIWGIAAD